MKKFTLFRPSYVVFVLSFAGLISVQAAQKKPGCCTAQEAEHVEQDINNYLEALAKVMHRALTSIENSPVLEAVVAVCKNPKVQAEVLDLAKPFLMQWGIMDAAGVISPILSAVVTGLIDVVEESTNTQAASSTSTTKAKGKGGAKSGKRKRKIRILDVDESITHGHLTNDMVQHHKQ
jgi:hypothetical protein